jgi:hypothetical protein
MLVRIDLLDNDGQVIARKEGDAMQPLSFRTHAEVPLEDARFRYYGFSYAPLVVLKPLETTR